MIDNLISDQMKQNWINLELYFQKYEFSTFEGFFWIFSKFFWIFSKFLLIFSWFFLNQKSIFLI